ncbi:non-ribosomal peptide synthetase [Streptomyces sp. SCSIO 30461]|uniref:non-ribosomal peptide synthetase n=1 Tax=Streptomyces sp. SCSIO 30461 TaxID=3118085 RepID=UPI0030CC88F5
MSTVDLATVPDGDTAHPLSPFQRAALRHPRRRVHLAVRVPHLAVPDLLTGVHKALAAMPVLRCALVTVPGLRLPRQAPQPTALEQQADGAWRLAAGNLTVSARPNGDGMDVDLEADPVFADRRTLELFLLHAAGSPAASAGPGDFFVVAAEHGLMQAEGELDEEEKYWKAVSDGAPASDTRAALGLQPGSTAADCVRSRPLGPSCSASLTALADHMGCRTSDLALLALRVLLSRVVPGTAELGRVVDTRGLMGLDDEPGPMVQVLPGYPRIAPDMDALVAWETQRDRDSQEDEAAGGMAVVEGQPGPGLVFDPHTRWEMPAGWELTDAHEFRSGAVLLGLESSKDGDHLTATSCDGVDEAALGALLTSWAALLEDLVTRPGTAVGSLHLNTSEALGRIRESWDAADAGRTEDLCAAVASLARHDPAAPAVRHGDLVLSRADLLGCIGSVAAELGDIAPGDVVAVVGEAHPDLVAAFLAVLWRGASFLPLAPSEPRHRLEDAIRRAGATLVLACADTPELAVADTCQVLPLAAAVARPTDPGEPECSPGATAYLLRTSGTTGRPKLVPIRRSSLNTYLRWVARDLLAEPTAIPVLSAPVFDASFKQLFGPLLAGQPVWLLASDRTDMAAVHEELRADGRELTLNCVPGYWSELQAAGADSGPLPLARLLLGGEAVTPSLLRRTQERYPGAEVWNLYGPTEATATATAGLLSPGEEPHVGMAVADATVAVADADGHPLPHGLRGEVWIAGPGLSTGYFGQADAPTPFAALRLPDGDIPAYRTGDCGTVGPDGRLRLHGRLDDQVKLRGWRIEPAEIERTAETAPGVRSAAVVLDDRGDNPRLALFLTGEADSALVRAHLELRLPAAMVPAAVTVVPTFPLTTTGKVDRRALLEKLRGHVEVSPEDYTPCQLTVATAWREILGGGWPHPDQEFFAAGGHSLLLARLVNRLRAQGHNGLSLRQVVRRPTVGSIAVGLDHPEQG